MSGVFSEHAKSYGAGLTVGSTVAFAELELARSDLETLNSSSFLYSVSAAYQGSLNQRGTAQLCPVARVGWAKGPNNINGTGSDYSENDLSLGLDAGVIASSTTQQVLVVPTASIAIARANTEFTGVLGPGSNSHTFTVLGLGVGFVFGQEVSVTPSVSRPVGLSGAATNFSVTVAFHFGGPHVPQVMNVPSHPTSCAGLASTDSVVYDTTQLTERPSLRTAPVRAYPPLQRELRIQGQVIMAVTIGPDGTPEQGSARIVRGVDPAIDREALRWIGGASYWPACSDGRPVRARVAQRLDFCPFGPCRRAPP